MLTKLEKVKETLLISLLNVALPTADMLTDLISITKLYIGTETHTRCDEWDEVEPFVDNSTTPVDPYTVWTGGKRMCIEMFARSSPEGLGFTSHPIWATSLLVPFLINYLVTWFIWWSVDKKKTISWIAPLLSVYPQVYLHPMILM